MNPLCIYHSGCDDGFGAAWAVWKALGDGVEFYAGVYQSPPPDVAGRDVIMVDFSYKRPIIEDMRETANSILILDHHKTAAEDLAGFQPPFGPGWRRHLDNVYQDRCEGIPQASLYSLFDMERSGAGLAWDFFHDLPRPRFINYIEDRDLWRTPPMVPYRDEFVFALRSYPQAFDIWDKLADDVDGLIKEGFGILRYYQLRCEELKRHAYQAVLAGYPIWIANAPYFAASEVAGELAARDGAVFGACYFEIEGGRYQYSLRSRGDFDVSEIAKKFGGGGHKGAAGFTVSAQAHYWGWGDSN